MCGNSKSDSNPKFFPKCFYANTVIWLKYSFVKGNDQCCLKNMLTDNPLFKKILSILNEIYDAIGI